MRIELYKRVKLFDSEGNLKEDSGIQPCNSFVLQFLQLVEAALRNVDAHSETVSIKDVTNTSRAIVGVELTSGYDGSDILNCNAGATDDSFGVVVGTGTGAESNTDYVLGTKIAHGTGSGQLEYEGTNWAIVHSEAGGLEFDIWRTFHNDSGGSITIEEIGIYVVAYDGTSYHNICIIRDLNTQAVANTETCSVEFSFRTVV